jgi:hypothetical protein
VVYQDNKANKYKIYRVTHSWKKHNSPTVYIVVSSDKDFIEDFKREAKTEWYFKQPGLEGKVEVLRYTFNHLYNDADNYIIGFEIAEENVFDTIEDAQKFKEDCEKGTNGVRFFYWGEIKAI